MDVLINPKKLEGELRVIASKSITHRALISAGLASGTSLIKNPLHSNDTYATIDMLQTMGVKIDVGTNTTVTGKTLKKTSGVLDAKESGSSIRFLIPVGLTMDESVVFDGQEGLRKRPQKIYFDLFDKHGITYKKMGIEDLPFSAKGPLKPGNYELKGDVSSQFISGLMFALPLLKEDSVISLSSPLESVGYVDLTIDVLKSFGIEIIEEKNTYLIKGNQTYKACEYDVEGDYSQAAFFLVMATLGSKISLSGMNPKSLQGDKAIIDIINSMNGEVYFKNDLLFANKKQTKGITIDLSQTPDLGPILAVLASLSTGKTVIVNASRLRIKESDRIKAMVCELTKMGANIKETEDGMIITGVSALKGNVTLDAWNDHRIVMALSVAATRASGPVRITNAEAVRKSYPGFFEDYKLLKGDVSFE